ncbi:MAG: hypothetical protein DRP87_12940 [Spirochaetes bacterium]|nr:MAG: hypothetical protein DRP87_12940 [Spirochaetota bacterium]
MFGIGFWEIVIIAVLIIIFINPKDLPSVFRKIGVLYRQINGLYRDVSKWVNEMETEVKKEYSLKALADPDHSSQSGENNGKKEEVGNNGTDKGET